MDMRVLGVVSAIALAVMGGCTADEDGNNNAGQGALGGVGGTMGGVGGMAGVMGGVGGAMGGVGGMAGVMGGVGGAMGGVGGTMGGVGGTMGGVGGMMGGVGGMMGGVGGETGGTGGMVDMGDGGVTDTASCIAAAAADGRTGACSDCGCMKCLAEIMNCQDDACQSIVMCGQASGCSGSACYCGDDLNACILFADPTGPCVQEIETASGLVADGTCTTKGCAAPLSMLAMTDPDNPVQRARALSICTQGQRYAAETAFTAEVPEIMGMCQTECAAGAGM